LTSPTIVRVQHRHGDQKPADPDLVIEVGKPPPPFYQRHGQVVRSIVGDNPLRCILGEGDEILIGRHKVTVISHA
jgi:hypothetical protein